VTAVNPKPAAKTDRRKVAVRKDRWLQRCVRHQTQDKISENKIPNPLASNEKTVAAFELRINANKLVTIISATDTQRIVIVGCKLRIAVLCGTSRIERKHKPSAIMPAMPMVSLGVMMPNDQKLSHAGTSASTAKAD
jgi:hypothetical protein